MSDEENASSALKAYGGVFKSGSGLLGKSAIVVTPVAVGILAVGWTLHNDWAKIAAMGLAGFIFLVWYMLLMRFCDKHPAEALLDGVQWATHQQILLTTKGNPPIGAPSTQTPGIEVAEKREAQSGGEPQ